ncbi:MAG: nitrogen regulation protein NR(I) [Proteobacteria bacterium]|jgi:two-component system, NtrC family, nitrogen regulation response regulator GlnG|nr:nitrogen regulation protein NR(I) [Pseudomonadota bacterium]
MNNVWVVDDDDSIRWVLSRALEKAGFDTRQFSDAESVLGALGSSTPSVIMTDIRMGKMSGLDLAHHIAEHHADVPVIIMTAHTDLDSALASYKTGAFEYLPKPFDLQDAIDLVKRAIEQSASSQSVASASPVAAKPEFIGEAKAMQEVFRAIGRLAKSNINVLIRGQSGTGKELVAGVLHKSSPRSGKPFVAINIAAIPAELLESELFGHEKGAFTGAIERRVGRFEQANGGTLFLDEIGDMPAELQTRLLRVLSDRRFYRVGGRDLISADVRVLAATNQDLEARVKDGRFREDLYHRLNVIRIDIPTLFQRTEDIPVLAARFLKSCSAELDVDEKVLSDESIAAMKEYSWPGNVRQLENVCRWITVMAPGSVVDVDDLPPEILVPDEQVKSGVSDWETALSELARQKLNLGEENILGELTPKFEGLLLKAALQYTGGRRQDAARRLGWGRNTLTRKLKELRVDVD